MKEHHRVLKTPQYGNCQVLSPDGQLMFKCGQKKINWYLKRNLGVLISHDPLVIQLSFIPKGVGHINDPYFLQEMKNRCVVCGSEDDLTRHHIVPLFYRKHFPAIFKEHRSYDVMALCWTCHRKYEAVALDFKEQLAKEHGISLHGEGGKYNKELGKAVCAVKALEKHGDKIPKDRQLLLLDIIKSYLNKEDLIDEDLVFLGKKKRSDLFDQTSYIHHGKKVVGEIGDDSAELEKFVKRWRLHFIEEMKPQFLPKDWTVDRPL